jgi:hypothetical protein
MRNEVLTAISSHCILSFFFRSALSLSLSDSFEVPSSVSPPIQPRHDGVMQKHCCAFFLQFNKMLMNYLPSNKMIMLELEITRIVETGNQM